MKTILKNLMLRNMTVENLGKKWMIKHKKGFTLFELLIALFIGTILIMSGAYAIRTGLFSMEREEAWFNDTTKEKAAFDFFWQQVSSLRVQKIPRKDDLLAEEKKTERIPRAIKLSVTKNGNAQELISPIMAMYSFLASGQ